MTNIKEEFEKWKSRLDYYQISDYIWFDVWQAAHEAQQVRIDRLENDCVEVGKDYAKAMFKNDDLCKQITALEARCALALSLLTVNDMSDSYLMSNCITLAKQALSTKSPTEKEVE